MEEDEYTHTEKCTHAHTHVARRTRMRIGKEGLRRKDTHKESTATLFDFNQKLDAANSVYVCV